MSLARIGAGPWAVVDVLAPDEAFYGTTPPPWPRDLDLFRCACCGAALQWRVIVEGPEGFRTLGRTCADKASRATPESISLEGIWAVVDVLAPDEAFYGTTPPPWPRDLDLFRCACCGAALQWRVIVEGPEGFRTLGRTCADKASRATPESISLEGIGLKLKAAERRERDKMLRAPAFEAWAKAQPHPKGWKGRSLLDDVTYHATGKSINMAPLRKAWRAFEEATRGKA